MDREKEVLDYCNNVRKDLWHRMQAEFKSIVGRCRDNNAANNMVVATVRKFNKEANEKTDGLLKPDWFLKVAEGTMSSGDPEAYERSGLKAAMKYV